DGLLEPVRSFTAGNAPSAALVLIELDGPQRELDHADRLIDDDDAARAEHRPSFADLIEVEADVDLFGKQHGRRRSAGHDGFELLAAANAARNLVDCLLHV